MTSSAASARYGVPCSACGAEPDEPCRAQSGRVTDAHTARIKAWRVVHAARCQK